MLRAQPEVLADEGRADYGPPIDVYAFAVVLWQLLTSSRPYSNLNLHRFLLLHKIAREGLRPDLPAWMPTSLAQLIRECWAEADHERPTANELVRRLLATDAADEANAAATPCTGARSGEHTGVHGRLRTTSDPSATDLVPLRRASSETCAVTRSISGMLRPMYEEAELSNTSTSASPSPRPSASSSPGPSAGLSPSPGCAGPSDETDDYTCTYATPHPEYSSYGRSSVVTAPVVFGAAGPSNAPPPVWIGDLLEQEELTAALHASRQHTEP